MDVRDEVERGSKEIETKRGFQTTVLTMAKCGILGQESTMTMTVYILVDETTKISPETSMQQYVFISGRQK